MCKMDQSELVKQPQDATECPYYRKGKQDSNSEGKSIAQLSIESLMQDNEVSSNQSNVYWNKLQEEIKLNQWDTKSDNGYSLFLGHDEFFIASAQSYQASGQYRWNVQQNQNQGRKRKSEDHKTFKQRKTERPRKCLFEGLSSCRFTYCPLLMTFRRDKILQYSVLSVTFGRNSNLIPGQWFFMYSHFLL